MEYYAEKYTDKHPLRYVVKSPSYFVFTTNKRHFVRLLNAIKRKGLTDITPAQALKLSMSTFTCNKTH